MGKPAAALFVGLGGGGDTIGAALLADDAIERGLAPVIAGLAWERFVKDPLPGPRSPRELTDVQLLTPTLARVTPRTAFQSGAVTNQAALADHLGLVNNFLLEAQGGASSIADGLLELQQMFQFNEVWGVDVGGDVLAHEPVDSLRTPLCDALVLAALTRVFPTSLVVVLGLGVDGELPQERLRVRVYEDVENARAVPVTPALAKSYATINDLFDRRLVSSEATAIVARAYIGLRGMVLMRDAGSLIQVDEHVSEAFAYRAVDIYRHINPIARVLSNSTTLEMASHAVETLGFKSELRYETEKLERLVKPYPSAAPSAVAPLLRSEIARIRSELPMVDYVTERYVAERIGVDMRSLQDVVDNGLAPFVRVS